MKYYSIIISSLFFISAHSLASNVNSVIPRNENAPEQGKENDAYKLNIQPQLTVDDNTLKPTITLYTRSKSFFTRTYKGDNSPFFDNFVLFKFSANSGIDVSTFDNPSESAEDIISNYVADGGNIEFDLSYRIQYNSWDFSLGMFYSLLTTDALSTQQGTSDLISVDAEIYGFSAFLSYSFNDVILYGELRNFNTSDEGKNADFTSILDDGDAAEFGVSFPLSVLSLNNEGSDNQRDGFYLTLSRTKHTEVDKAIFRVTVQKRFNF